MGRRALVVRGVGYASLPLFAVGANTYVFTLDTPMGARSGFEKYFDFAFAFGMIGYLGFVYWLLRTAGRETVVKRVVVAVSSWIAAPAVVGFALWDSFLSARAWAVVAWRWALAPLPIEVHKVFGWTPPELRMTLFEGAVMVALQLASLGLAFGAAAVLIRHLMPTESTSEPQRRL